MQRDLFASTQTTVANIRLHEYDIYVGRPRGAIDPARVAIGCEGWLGNPYDVRRYPDALDRFREYFICRVETEPAFRAAVMALRGKRLGCFCVDQHFRGACHARIIAEWVNEIEHQTRHARPATPTAPTPATPARPLPSQAAPRSAAPPSPEAPA